ncbi:MAG: hypothetical protein J0M20_15410, partial [Burkholderiales bacterium]|nr:hypothetical protein [Burkholderiales bacterium]
MTSAAEAITARLETLFAEPGPEPEPEPALPAEPDIDFLAGPIEGPVVEEQPPAEEGPVEAPEPVEEARPQADFAPPITTAFEPEPVSEPEPDAEVSAQPEPTTAFDAPPGATDAELDIPQAPLDSRPFSRPREPEPQVTMEVAPYEFIPARRRPEPAPKELSVIWYLLLALFGLAFFGFGIFWGLTWRGASSFGGLPLPLIVAWTAGLA